MPETRRPSVLFDLYVAWQLTGQLLELELAGSEVPVSDRSTMGSQTLADRPADLNEPPIP